MTNLVTKTLVRDSRKHFKSTMIDTVTNLRTGVSGIPFLIAVQRQRVRHRGMPENLKVRTWRLMMPDRHDAIWNGTTIATGDRLLSSDGRTFMVTEITDWNTYNVATSVMALITNAKVIFKRPSVTPSVTPTSQVDVYINRVADELKPFVGDFEWEVWFGSDIQFSNGSTGGVLISRGDQMAWNRTPNPVAPNGQVTLDRPRYAYAESAIVACYFKEMIH